MLNYIYRSILLRCDFVQDGFIDILQGYIIWSSTITLLFKYYRRSRKVTESHATHSLWYQVYHKQTKPNECA